MNDIPIGFRKGSVCIGLKVYDTGLCFYNCHLSAHEQDKVLEESECAYFSNDLYFLWLTHFIFFSVLPLGLLQYIGARNKDMFQIINGVRLGHPILEVWKKSRESDLSSS